MNDKLALIFGIPNNKFYDGLKEKKVFVAELRPGLEGIKRVAPQLLKRKIQPVVICDNMMAHLMQQGLVKEVDIFSHRESSKKSYQCRAGSFIAAICANQHKIPVYLEKSGFVPEKNAPLSRIAGAAVTLSSIKTHAPVFEEVPLNLVSRIRVN